MGTMSNTLILALPEVPSTRWCLCTLTATPPGQITNMYSIGIEIIQGIASTMGVILTVPIVSVISAWYLKRKKISEKTAAESADN